MVFISLILIIGGIYNIPHRIEGGYNMNLIQAVFIGWDCALTQLEGDWLGECKIREPVITGFLVGLIMGDVAKGLFIGGSL